MTLFGFINFSGSIIPDMNEKSFLIELLETFSTSFIILMLIYWFVALPEVVFGASMEPTFYTGERILVEKVTKHFKDFERGDIVVLYPPGNDTDHYVKRIVGVEGDIFKISNCKVYITREDGKFELEEPYLSSSSCTGEGSKIKEGFSIKLGAGEYIVLGDNRERSVDSRTLGIIKEDRIVGRVAFRFWPLDKVRFY